MQGSLSSYRIQLDGCHADRVLMPARAAHLSSNALLHLVIFQKSSAALWQRNRLDRMLEILQALTHQPCQVHCDQDRDHLGDRQVFMQALKHWNWAGKLE